MSKNKTNILEIPVLKILIHVNFSLKYGIHRMDLGPLA